MSKAPRQKMPKGKSTQDPAPINDARFSHIYTDPRFRLPSKRQTHVALDKRFAHMLRDDDFSRKAAVDRYGRKIPKSSGKKELQRFYRLADEDDEGDDELNVADDDEDVRRELARVDRKYDPARDGGFSSSSSSSSGETSSSEEDEEDKDATEQGEDGYGLPDMRVEGENDVPMGDVSSRIAVVNLDWDNIRAVDLMAVFSSFCPPTGRILRVAVYPSQFGKERMEREEMEGPPKEIFAGKMESLNETDGDEEEAEEEIKKSLLQEDKGEEFDSTKLRRYQLERLRYYYAVLTISSAETAKALYDATDGTEYLTTANFFDLRFVPDDVSFDDDRPRDECTIIPDRYKPNSFVTDALQHSKVKLTWDAEDNIRKEVVKKAFGGSRAEIEENDLKAYLGSDTSEDEELPNQANGNSEEANSEVRLSKKERERQRLRAALGLGDVSSSSKRNNQAAPVGDMQITFTSGLSRIKKDNMPGHEETTVEKYIRKEKERKQRRKEKVTASRNGELSNGDTRPQNGKNHADTEPDNSDLGFDDPFFTSATGDDAESSRSKKPTSRRNKEARRKDNDVLTSQNRAELELLMLDDDPNTNQDAQQQPNQTPQGHFNMKDILRAERKQSRRKKNKRAAQADNNNNNHNPPQQQEQAGFNMDVTDPRFAALYQNHEFAIDPTNPRFKDTRAMRAILDQARRKRGGVGEEEEEEGRRREKKKKRRRAEENGDGQGEELKSLVERVKGRVRVGRVGRVGRGVEA